MPSNTKSSPQPMHRRPQQNHHHNHHNNHHQHLAVAISIMCLGSTTTSANTQSSQSSCRSKVCRVQAPALLARRSFSTLSGVGRRGPTMVATTALHRFPARSQRTQPRCNSVKCLQRACSQTTCGQDSMAMAVLRLRLGLAAAGLPGRLQRTPSRRNQAGRLPLLMGQPLTPNLVVPAPLLLLLQLHLRLHLLQTQCPTLIRLFAKRCLQLQRSMLLASRPLRRNLQHRLRLRRCQRPRSRRRTRASARALRLRRSVGSMPEARQSCGRTGTKPRRPRRSIVGRRRRWPGLLPALRR